MAEANAPQSLLPIESQQRIEALNAARRVLNITPSLFGGSQVPNDQDVVQDLITLSEYILLGFDDEDDPDDGEEADDYKGDPVTGEDLVIVGDLGLESLQRTA